MDAFHDEPKHDRDPNEPEDPPELLRAVVTGGPRGREGQEGYPAKPRSGDAISGLPASRDDLVVFHAGTRRDGAVGDPVVTAGGRVLGVTAYGADLAAARARAYGAIEQIRFDGMHFRRDIGLRGSATT